MISILVCDIYTDEFSFQIVITAQRGTGNGYVALDDFTFEHTEFCDIKPDDATPTTSTATPTTTLPHLPSCQFEQDACEWETFGLRFKWFITNNSNLDSAGQLGPLGPSAGNYLYASAKDGVSGQNTYIESPTMDATESGVCMRFSFSMFVSDINLIILSKEQFHFSKKEEYSS